MDLTDPLGYAASGLVFLTFCMNRMVPLRITAIASNLAFIAYALAGELLPVLMLHLVLLPTNILRLSQLRRRMVCGESRSEERQLELALPGVPGRAG